jgi:hypothetical protein
LISRVCDVSINTVSKLLIDAGKACASFHDANVRDVKSRRIQVDEIWSFTYAKQKNVPTAKRQDPNWASADLTKRQKFQTETLPARQNP